MARIGRFGRRHIRGDSLTAVLNANQPEAVQLPWISQDSVYENLRRTNKWLSTLSALTEPGFGLGISWVLSMETVCGVLPSLANLLNYSEQVPVYVKGINGGAAWLAGVIWAYHAYHSAREIYQGEVNSSMTIVPVVAEVRSGGRELVEKQIHARDLVELYKGDHDWLQIVSFCITYSPVFETVKSLSRPYSSGTLANWIAFTFPKIGASAASINKWAFPAFGVLGLAMQLTRLAMAFSVRKDPRREVPKKPSDIPGYMGLSWENVNKRRLWVSFGTAFFDALTENSFMMMIFLDIFGVVNAQTGLYFGLMFGISAFMALFSGIGGVADEGLRQLRLDKVKQQYYAAYNESVFPGREKFLEPLDLNTASVPWQRPQNAQQWMNLGGALLLSAFTTMIVNNLFNCIDLAAENRPGEVNSYFQERWRLLVIMVFSLIWKGLERSRLDTHEYFADRYEDELKALQKAKAELHANQASQQAPQEAAQRADALEGEEFTVTVAAGPNPSDTRQPQDINPMGPLHRQFLRPSLRVTGRDAQPASP
jgi:hypothetical protein